MKNKKLQNRQKGQMLIIILLVMVVGLTIGLFLMGRTTTDISLTTRSTDSVRAFNGAEAGIEETLKVSSFVVTGSPVPAGSGITYTVNKEDLGEGTGIYPSIKEAPIDLGNFFTVWLTPHLATGFLNETGTGAYKNNNITICFTDNISIRPAIGVTLYYKDVSDYKSSYAAYDSVSSRTNSVNFLDISNSVGDCGSNGYNYRVVINFNTHFLVNITSSGILPIALRIRPIYAASSIAVIPRANLPKQGDIITSLGKAGEANRKIMVNDPYIVPAPFLDSAIYSKGNLEK